MEANSGACERVYSHCSARSLSRAARRAWRSDGAGAAQAVAAASSNPASRNFDFIRRSPLYRETPYASRRAEGLGGPLIPPALFSQPPHTGREKREKLVEESCLIGE